MATVFALSGKLGTSAARVKSRTDYVRICKDNPFKILITVAESWLAGSSHYAVLLSLFKIFPFVFRSRSSDVEAEAEAEATN